MLEISVVLRHCEKCQEKKFITAFYFCMELPWATIATGLESLSWLSQPKFLLYEKMKENVL